MQRNCIFPGRYAPLTYYDWLRGRPRNTLMARNAREICNFFANLYLHNGLSKRPFYIGTYFEPIWTLLPEDVAVLNPTGYRTL